MRTMKLALAALVFASIGLGAAYAGETRAQQILDRFQHANLWRDHVMVVAHRSGGLQHGKTLFPENSLAALKASISAGAEMVEVDVRRAGDGTLIVMHDSWLDRTTTWRPRITSRFRPGFDSIAMLICMEAEDAGTGRFLGR